ncbi:hypothetical protein [Lacticaseibacillus saniviri]|uniref:hypothetical protein n=1 Tax=Lacticaseibacillus saniviri TaxID=931533 RepID=UPI00138F3138|nr:hypothetical protein [Lacticaseibacillus saniviri]
MRKEDYHGAPSRAGMADFHWRCNFLIASDHSPVPAPQRLQIQTELRETVDIAKNKFDQFVANSQTQPKVEVTQQAQPKVNVTQQEAAANRTQSRQADTGQATPIVSIVQDVSLRRTYYYTFAANDSQAVRNVFAHAVDVYNATGLVNLIPGKAQVRKIKLSSRLITNKCPPVNATPSSWAKVGPRLSVTCGVARPSTTRLLVLT